MVLGLSQEWSLVGGAEGGGPRERDLHPPVCQSGVGSEKGHHACTGGQGLPGGTREGRGEWEMIRRSGRKI